MKGSMNYKGEYMNYEVGPFNFIFPCSVSMTLFECRLQIRAFSNIRKKTLDLFEAS